MIKCATCKGKLDINKQPGERFVLKLSNDSIFPIGYLDGCDFVGVKVYKITEEGKIPMWYKGKPCSEILVKKILWPFQVTEMEFKFTDFKMTEGKYEVLVEVDKSWYINNDFWKKRASPAQISSGIFNLN